MMPKQIFDPSRVDRRAVGQILREIADVPEEEVEKAVKAAKKTGARTLEVLEMTRAITEEDKQKTLARKWGLDYCDLSQIHIPDEMLRQVPDWLLKEHKAIPISVQGDTLVLGITDPLNVRAIDEISAATGFSVKPVVVRESQVVSILESKFGFGEKIDSKTFEGVLDEVEQSVDIDYEETANDEDVSVDIKLTEEEPIVRLVNAILIKGIGQEASDIHIQPEEDGIRVRYRVDGILHDASNIPKVVGAPVVSRVKVMAGLDIAERRRPQDGRIDLTMDGKRYDLRVSTLPIVHGEKIVLRIAEQDMSRVSLNSLGFSESTLRMVEEAILRPYGMILATGPTGSGKSTTLYSILERINTPEKNVVTVENPVERRMRGLSQVDISSERCPMTFASALRSILRQDPDVVMVGEIRDYDTAVIATEASLTGHLVLSTLHTNDAPGAVSRLIEMGVEPFLVSSSLLMVIAQRLVRKLCDSCKEPYEMDWETLNKLGFSPPGEPGENFPIFKAKPSGCSICQGRGYKGRMGVFEVLSATDEIRDLVLEKAPATRIRAVARDQGMQPMLYDAFAKILQGKTSIEEALRVVDIETR